MVVEDRLILEMVGDNYKRSMDIAHNRQQLQEVYKRYGCFLKFVEDCRCNMMVIAIRR